MSLRKLSIMLIAPVLIAIPSTIGVTSAHAESTPTAVASTYASPTVVKSGHAAKVSLFYGGACHFGSVSSTVNGSAVVRVSKPSYNRRTAAVVTATVTADLAPNNYVLWVAELYKDATGQVIGCQAMPTRFVSTSWDAPAQATGRITLSRGWHDVQVFVTPDGGDPLNLWPSIISSRPLTVLARG